MISFMSNDSAQGARYLLCLFLSVFSATTLLTIASAQQLCNPQMCISATIFSKDPSTIEFTLSTNIPVGWVGLGMGGISNGMSNNDLALCWPDSSGNGTFISERSAPENFSPSPTASVSFTIQQAKSGLSSPTLNFTCTFSRPLALTAAPISSTASSINVIYAIGLQIVNPDPSGNPQLASIQQHAYTGYGVLDIQRKYGASSDPNNTIIIPPFKGGANMLDEALAGENKYNALIKAHGYLMTIAFLLFFPVGAMIMRFFSHIHMLFSWHRPIQVAGFIFVLTGIGCVVGAVYSTPPAPPLDDSAHGVIGVVLVSLLALQVSYGLYIFHAYNPNLTVQLAFHRFLTWIHRGWGYCVIILGFVQVHLGITLYGEWPEGNEVVWWLYYFWIAIVVAVVLIGSLVKYLRSSKLKSLE